MRIGRLRRRTGKIDEIETVFMKAIVYRALANAKFCHLTAFLISFSDET
jgi:hypothetical protein